MCSNQSSSSGNHFHKKLALDIKLLTTASFDNLSFIGFISVSWCGHLVDYAIPIQYFLQQQSVQQQFQSLFQLNLPSLKAF
jgi:hypothetical protein